MKHRYLSYRDYFREKRRLRRLYLQTHKQLITFSDDYDKL